MCFSRSQMRDMDPGLIELFVDGKEDGLPDSGRLDGLGLGSGSVVFMLHRLGWRWEECGTEITLSGEGLVATRDKAGNQPVTGGPPMTEGRHYWEVEVTWRVDDCCINVGAVRPGLDHIKGHANTNSAYYIYGYNGALWGNGKGVALMSRVVSRRATASECCLTSTPAGCGSTATTSGAGRASRRA
jgi:hypothetical protein